MAKEAERWTRVMVRVSLAVADALGARCIELGAPGVIVDERNLRRGATTDGAVRVAQRTIPARFTAYFPPTIDPHRLEAELRASLDAITRELSGARKPVLHIEPYRPQSYEKSWRRHFPPIRTGNRLLLAPSWTKAKDLRDVSRGRIVLRVDPAQAFGTGHHPTTRGCLVALERVCAAEPAMRRGLDVGSGTGVLAVAMRALGVADVVAVDTDPVARDATRACADANGFAGMRVLPSLGAVRGQYDVVTANLFAGLLTAMAAQLAARIRPGGHLIVAGLLASQEDAVERALRAAGFRRERRECRATWTTLTLTRTGRAGKAAKPARTSHRRAATSAA